MTATLNLIRVFQSTRTLSRRGSTVGRDLLSPGRTAPRRPSSHQLPTQREGRPGLGFQGSEAMTVDTVDIRIPVGLPDHRKTRRLVARCGEKSYRMLQRLWLWARQYRPEGILHGMTDDDVEAEARWDGDPGEFVSALLNIGWADRLEDETLELHEWLSYQPWSAGATGRSVAASKAANTRWHNLGAHDKSPLVRVEIANVVVGDRQANVMEPDGE